MTKYQPITEFLRGQPVSEWRASFQKIESILGFSLPRSARSHPAWWANNPGGHSHCLAWLDAGWKTEQIDLEAEKVTFRKVRAAAEPNMHLRPSLFGGLKGTVTIAPGVDLTEPTGEVWAAAEGRLDE